MGEWKAPLSLRVKQDLRKELEARAAHEKRTVGNLGEVLLEWGMEQLKEAGSIERLIHHEVPVPRNPAGNYRRKA